MHRIELMDSTPEIRAPGSQLRPRRDRFRAAVPWLLAALLPLAACADSGTGPGAVDRILIDRTADTTLFTSESVDLRAVAVDGERREIVALTRSIEWTSDAPSVVDVDRSSGVVVARAPGTARVRAAAGGVDDVVTFRVSYAVALVQVELPDGASLNVADEFRACAVARAANGSIIADVEPRWSVSDRSVLALGATAGHCTTISALQQGSATVIAEVDDQRGEGTVRVLGRDDDDDEENGNGGNGNGNGNNGNGNGNGGG